MTVFTEGLMSGSEPSIRELWADNLTHNTSLVTGAAKIVAVCVAVAFVAWMIARLVSPKGGRIGHVVKLWLKAKERELGIRAEGSDQVKDR